MSPCIERPQPADAEAVRRLLAAAQLPVDDLLGRPLDDFLVLRSSAGIEGAVGVDFAGDVGLLRSLVVAGSRRRQGWGQRLVAAAEAAAWKREVRALYLLTTTAAPFFSRLGYRPVDRAAAPPAIVASAQFASLCPATSAFMAKDRPQP